MLPDIPEAIGLPPGFMGLLLLAMGFPNTCYTLGIEGKTHVNVSLISDEVQFRIPLNLQVVLLQLLNIKTWNRHIFTLKQKGDLTWLWEVLVTPHTVVTTDTEPGGWLVFCCQGTES